MSELAHPKVSVIIPVYNREKFIGKCIESALAQTFSDLEVVVVDNASTDGTWSICQKYAEKDSRVRVFRNAENIGPVKNWKRCFDEARGEFGKILFSDDLIYPEYLSKTVPILNDPNVGFVFTNVEIAHEPSQDGRTVDNAVKSIPSAQYIHMNFFEPYKVPVSPCAALFRLNELRKNLVWDIPTPANTDFSTHGAGPDLLLYLLTASQYPSVVKLEDTLVLFRKHAGSITVSFNRNIIATYYAQSRIWFASKQLSPTIYHRLLAFEWLQHCWRTRHLVSFVAYMHSVTDDKEIVRFSALVWSIFNLVYVKTAHLLLRTKNK